ncbi:MAG TPA: RHS repeat-associated core domain-containing protein, partial [Rhodothermia bacterium]|nr:RHS repeat-associated core domain-containing protein [Rhodothermia bacterium]
MTLSLFDDSVIEERTYFLDTASAAPTRSERITRRRGQAGEVEQDRLEIYGEFYHWGAEGDVFEAVIAEIEDPDGAALATYYGYYDQTTQPGGKLSWIIHSDGYWEAYDRFQTTGKLGRTYRPWIDDPADPFMADVSNSLVTTITYDHPQPNIEVKVEDTIWKSSFRTAYRATTTTFEPDDSVVETTETFLSATAGTLDQTVRDGWHGRTIGTYETRGALRTFNNVWGYWDPANRTFGSSAGAGSIVAERTIEIEGTPDQPAGIAGRTTIGLRYSDDRGRVLHEETYVNDGNPFQPGVRTDWISQRSNIYSPDGQLLQASENGRVVFEAEYDADGQLHWSSDELGIRTEFEHDDFGRVFRTVRIAGPSTPDRTTTFEFDAAGRVVSQTVEAGIGSDALSETTEYRYDPAGRLIRTIAPDGLELAVSETMLIGANGSPQRRQVVTTNPDGSEEIAEFYRDRRLFRRYGTAAPEEVWGYGVNGIGFVSAAFRDLAGTQLRSRRDADWTGNTVLDVLPGFSGQGLFVRTNTYGDSGPFGTVRGLPVSSSEPGRATGLFEYDELGRLTATGLDLDADGVLDRGGTDPISFSRLAFESEGSPAEWERVVRTTRLETEGSMAETLMSKRREKLGALSGGLVASVESLEPGGARFQTEVTLDRATGTRTTAVRDLAASESAPPAATVEVAGLLRSTRTPEATAETVYEYNALGRMKSVASPLGGTTNYLYDSSGRLETTTDSLLRETHLTYHPQGQAGAGRVATSRDPAGNTTHFDYDARGRLWRQWGANVYPQQFGYDDDNRLTSLRTFRTKDAPAAGGVDWTPASWPANAPEGDLTQRIYDPSGLLERKRYADGSEVVYSYDSARRLQTRTNARGQTITHNFNPLGLQESVLYPLGSLTANCSYIYDRAGRLRSLTDASGTRTLAYDPETGGVTGETSSSGPLAGQSVVRCFDAFGRQESLDVPSVFALGWEYDPLNRPERITGASGTVSGLEVTYVRESGSDRLENIEWRHEAVLRLQSARSYDAISRLTGVTTLDGSGTVLQNHGYAEFDELDRRTRVDREDGKNWNYDYDARGQLTGAGMQDEGGQSIPGHEFSFAFDTIGNRTGTTQGSLASAYQANALNQYEERTVPGAIRVVGSAEADTFVTADFLEAARQGEWFNVDIPVDNSAAPVWKEFDVVAVRSGAGPNGEDDVASVVRSAFVAKTPEEFVHDPDGNLTSDGRWSYTWDAENRLVAMETQVGAVVPNGPLPESERVRLEFTYDCQSRRIAKKVFSWTGADWALASHALYLYDGWNVIAEFDALSGLSLARTYVWGLDLSGSGQGAGGVGGLLAVVDSNDTHAPWWDGNGNVTGYSNLESSAEEARYTYGPFGETLAATGPLANAFTHRFSTKFTDPESDLLYYGFRYYSPLTGRWLSRDPIEERGGANVRVMTSNNLISLIDVLGLNQEAGHFWANYFIFESAGIPSDEAFRLAYYSQLPDEFRAFDAITAGFASASRTQLRVSVEAQETINTYLDGYAFAHFGERMQNFMHSLHGGKGQKAIDARRDCLERLLKGGKLGEMEWGLVTHPFGDAFAHTYFEAAGFSVYSPTGVGQWIPNPFAGQESTWDYPVGHGMSGSDPDSIALAPDKFDRYARRLFAVAARQNADKAKFEAFLGAVKRIPRENAAANEFMANYVI